VLGLKTHPDIEAIDDEVDLALLVTPAASVPELLRACGRKGVAAAVVIAVGFGETGDEGRALEAEVAAVAAEHDIALVGPNTNGVFNLPERLNLVGAADVPRG
jgi:acetate---CoA ligase (ADP-forming)